MDVPPPVPDAAVPGADGRKPDGGTPRADAAVRSSIPSADLSSGGGSTTPAGDGGLALQPGTLTAGVWDDNLNFELFQAYRAKQHSAQLAGVLPLRDDEFEASHTKFTAMRDARQRLDVALVIDTTSSMSDEIVYLQTEFDAISRKVEAAYPNSQQRWSLIVYRDEGDAYVTQSFEFIDELASFRAELGAQRADGGGDFPEAPHAAFQAVSKLAWRADADVARLAFWVADAPHHAEHAASMADGLRSALQQDIHVYPVASSGVDELTELSMRSAAQLTGGRYVFLTDDSGVGGAHKEPSVPCYVVTKLDDALLRAIDAEMSGIVTAPSASLRSVGNPVQGQCVLSSGPSAKLF